MLLDTARSVVQTMLSCECAVFEDQSNLQARYDDIEVARAVSQTTSRRMTEKKSRFTLYLDSSSVSAWSLRACCKVLLAGARLGKYHNGSCVKSSCVHVPKLIYVWGEDLSKCGKSLLEHECEFQASSASYGPVIIPRIEY